LDPTEGDLEDTTGVNVVVKMLTWLGDSFSAGDVILEIETDKAQMDVEAQDDGILAKITVRNRIAVLTYHG
jgi:pyruvate/2-oxoglutarate dehydrogenase complex dihydrolipoamide acyltransferase (E2) component